MFCAAALLSGFLFLYYASGLATCFALFGRVSFLCVAKEKVPKERPPYCIGLRLLCALQLRAGAAELAIAQTVLALFRTKLPVLVNTKGILRSTTKSKSGRCNLMRSSDNDNCTFVIPAKAGVQK